MANRHLKPWFKVFCALIVIAVIVFAVLAVSENGDRPGISVSEAGQNSDNSKAPVSSEPERQPISVTLGCTGDILIHSPILKAYKTSSGYDFNDIFKYISPYFKKYDYMVANLEVTLAGDSKAYDGYPTFNSPDSLLDAMKQNGVDMLLTANNHCYDTGKLGFNRTVEVVNANFDHIGTRTPEALPYLVKDINGIKFGLINYTYETNPYNGRKTLNGLAMSTECEDLVNSFNYNDLDSFYAELEGHITSMRNAGAEAIILYIHWGNEYKVKPNSYQTTIAKKIADLGVDVIVGGHPHVVEPIEIIESEVTGKQTVCLYSLGNAVSNQRIAQMNLKTGHTEDGVIFETTFVKNPDDTVVLDKINIVPIWVNMHTDTSKHYHMLPLDKSIDWTSTFNINATTLKHCEDSYKRTMDLVGDGLEKFTTDYRKVNLNMNVVK